MRRRNDFLVDEFLMETNSVLRLPPLLEAADVQHHGRANSLRDHCIRTGWCAFRLCRAFRVDKSTEISTVQAALIHDITGDYGNESWIDHGERAARYMSGWMPLNERQKNAVSCHMFPSCKGLPRYKESWIVSLADKLVAIREYGSSAAARLFGYIPAPPMASWMNNSRLALMGVRW